MKPTSTQNEARTDIRTALPIGFIVCLLLYFIVGVLVGIHLRGL